MSEDEIQRIENRILRLEQAVFRIYVVIIAAAAGSAGLQTIIQWVIA